MSLYIGLMTMFIGCAPKGEVETVKPTVIVPTPTVAKNFEPPMPVVSQLDVGGRLWLLEDHDLPVVVMNIVLPGGSVTDPEGQWGLAELSNQMLLESTVNKTSTELSTMLYELAVDVGIQTTRQHTIVQISTHKDRIDSALEIISEFEVCPMNLGLKLSQAIMIVMQGHQFLLSVEVQERCPMILCTVLHSIF